MAPRSTFGLYPRQLAGLLATGSTAEAAQATLSPVQSTRQLLRHRLAGPLHLDRRCVDSLPAVLGRPCEELHPLAGRIVGDLLMAPGTPLAVLETLKEYGKGLSHRWEDGPEHTVAVAIYFAAIAAALVSHGRKITTRSYRDLARSLGMMMEDRWMTPELAFLFDSARKACERKER